METLRVNVDQNSCIGCGICSELCPGVFALDPQGISDANTSVISPVLISSVRQAAEECPTAAIKLY